jgi:hypothetical protein
MGFLKARTLFPDPYKLRDGDTIRATDGGANPGYWTVRASLMVWLTALVPVPAVAITVIV